PLPIHFKYNSIFKLIFLLFLFSLLFSKKIIFKISDFPLWFLLLAWSINIFSASEKLLAFKTYLDLVIPLVCIYYLTGGNSSTEKSLYLLAKIISVVSTIVALGGIFEVLFAYNPLYEKWIDNYFYKRYITGFVRPMSTQFNPAPLGTYLVGSLPFSFFLFKCQKRFSRFIGIIGIILGTVVLILTFSRGAFLGLVSMITTYFLIRKRYKSMLIFLMIIVIIILGTVNLPYPLNRFGMNLLIGQGGIASSFRMERIFMTIRILTRYFLTGIGFQHFRIRFYEFYQLKYNVPYEYMIADNMYLTLLAETGIIGFLAFFIFIFSILKRGILKLAILKDNPNMHFYLTMVILSLIGFLVNMAGYELFYWPNQYLHFCILVSLYKNFCCFF
ncbi:MAG: O-antigen ligase family protein, partial [Candidatus Omnitrophica bacterium]|nr:O-antigen ligase family protein [Candidatus Omnitrophota bacterium]